MDKPKPTTGFTNQIHSEPPLGNDTSKLVWMQAWGQCSCPSPWSRQGKIKSIFHSSQSQVTSITGRFMWIEFKFQVFHHQVILANLRQFQSKDSPALGSRELTSAAVATQPWKMLNAKAEITATSEKNPPRLKFSTVLYQPCQVLPCFGNGQGESLFSNVFSTCDSHHQASAMPTSRTFNNTSIWPMRLSCSIGSISTDLNIPM